MADLFLANVVSVRADGTLDLQRGDDAEIKESVPYANRDALPDDVVVVANIGGAYQAIARCGPPRVSFSQLAMSSTAPPTGQGWDEAALFVRLDGSGGIEGWLLL